MAIKEGFLEEEKKCEKRQENDWELTSAATGGRAALAEGIACAEPCARQEQDPLKEMKVLHCGLQAEKEKERGERCVDSGGQDPREPQKATKYENGSWICNLARWLRWGFGGRGTVRPHWWDA